MTSYRKPIESNLKYVSIINKTSKHIQYLLIYPKKYTNEMDSINTQKNTQLLIKITLIRKMISLVDNKDYISADYPSLKKHKKKFHLK
jgi:hypothetical protein